MIFRLSNQKSFFESFREVVLEIKYLELTRVMPSIWGKKFRNHLSGIRYKQYYDEKHFSFVTFFSFVTVLVLLTFFQIIYLYKLRLIRVCI